MSRAVEKSDTLLQNYPQVIFRVDREMKVNYLNPASGNFKELIGKKLAEMGNLDILAGIPGEVEQKIKVVFKTGEGCSHELVFSKSDGNRYYELIFMPLLEERDFVKSVLVFGRDISEKRELMTELSTQKAYFEQLFKNSPNATVLLDNNDRIIRVNKGFERVFGYSQQDVIGKTLNELIVPSQYLEQAVAYSREILAGGTITTDTIRKRKDGSLINVLVIGYPIISSAKQIGIYGIYQDITKQKQDELALINSEKKFRAIFNKANDAIFLTRLNKNGEAAEIIEVNEVTCNRLGYTREEVLEMNPYQLVDPEDVPRIKALMKNFKEDEKKTYQVNHLTRDGRKIPEEIKSHLIRLNGEKVVVSIARDITERKKAEERMNYLSFHDEMTGLYNRRYLENEIKRLNQSRNLPISVIMTDIDNLKIINDTYGHKRGDSLIIKAAELLKSVTRKADIVARMGGDEFVLILPGAGTAAAAGICRRIQNKCERYIGKKEIEISLSAGFAVKEKDSDDLELVLRKADRNMYKDKLTRKERT